MQLAWHLVLVLLALSWFVPGARAATTYYAAVNGSSGNSGLSASSPWPLDYALANCGPSATVIVLPGTYNFEAVIAFPYVTLKSQVKWGARIVGGSPCGIVTWPSQVTHDVTIDGFEVASSSQDGVSLYSANCTVRNCWIHNSGASHPYASGSGITIEGQYNNCLIENNLLENNGWDEGSPFDHGMYLDGSNQVVRNNVCRYNWGSGIANRELTGNNYYYNNITYNNHYYGFSSTQSSPGTTLFLLNNSFVEANVAFFIGSTASYKLTNNIIVGAGGFNLADGAPVGDYNLVPYSGAFPQAHEIVATDPLLVNKANGLYWLQSTSPARGRSAPGIAYPTDFWGNPQSVVSDLGACRYDSAYAADTRVLDPTPAGGADYWLVLNGSGGGTPPLTVTPSSRDYGTMAVGTIKDLTFTIQNAGASALSGNATVAAPFSIVLGSPYSLAAGQSQTVTVRYAPTGAGAVTQTVNFSGGLGATATVTGTATNVLSAPPGGFTFQASAGILTAPFMVTNGYVCQTVNTFAPDGGRAVYNFLTTTAGVYVVNAMVNAPDGSHNSFYVTMDGTPLNEPYNVWDVPYTSGFQSEPVAWRGNGTWDADAFVPKAFALSAGSHSLVFTGREANTLLQSIQIQPVNLTPPPAPASLQLVPAP